MHMRKALAVTVMAGLAACQPLPMVAPRPEAPMTVTRVGPDWVPMGVNLSGGEFNNRHVPGVYGKNYRYPGEADFEEMARHGIGLVRLPFRWERVQPELFGELSKEEIGRLREVLGFARARGMRVILDMHNYAQYKGRGKLGGKDLPVRALADVWGRLAGEFSGDPVLWGYELMNEPMAEKGVWPGAAQAALDAIRAKDKVTPVIVDGEGWSSATRWRILNEDLLLNDPSGKVIYTAHIYFDRNGSGTYKNSYETDHSPPGAGLIRLAPFAAWLRDHGQKGFIGEYGAPGDDPNWLAELEKFEAELARQCLPSTYWSGGPWWGDKYRLNISADKQGNPRPQMAILLRNAARYRAACQPEPFQPTETRGR